MVLETNKCPNEYNFTLPIVHKVLDFWSYNVDRHLHDDPLDETVEDHCFLDRAATKQERLVYPCASNRSSSPGLPH